jgi:hypothetical protein
MNKNNFVKFAVIVIAALVAGATGYFVFIQKPIAPPAAPAPAPETEKAVLTNEIVLSLLKGDLYGGECLHGGLEWWYDSCVVNISKENSRWIVSVTYDGLYNDSVRADRITADIIYQDEQWFRGEISRTQKCWPERGHQYFSTELCV